MGSGVIQRRGDSVEIFGLARVRRNLERFRGGFVRFSLALQLLDALPGQRRWRAFDRTNLSRAIECSIH